MKSMFYEIPTPRLIGMKFYLNTFATLIGHGECPISMFHRRFFLIWNHPSWQPVFPQHSLNSNASSIKFKTHSSIKYYIFQPTHFPPVVREKWEFLQTLSAPGPVRVAILSPRSRESARWSMTDPVFRPIVISASHLKEISPHTTRLPSSSSSPSSLHLKSCPVHVHFFLPGVRQYQVTAIGRDADMPKTIRRPVVQPVQNSISQLRSNFKRFPPNLTIVTRR